MGSPGSQATTLSPMLYSSASSIYPYDTLRASSPPLSALSPGGMFLADEDGREMVGADKCQNTRGGRGGEKAGAF